MTKLKAVVKKHWALIGVGIIMTSLLIGYFILHANLEKVTKTFVSIATQGEYRLEMDKLKLSLVNRKIELFNATIFPTASAETGDHYRIILPSFYIKAQSWTSLITGKIDIDSIYISHPEFAIYKGSQINSSLRPGIEMAKVMEDLKAVMNLLSIRSLKLESGTFKAYTQSTSMPFICKGIDILIESFGKSVGRSGTFLAADEFSITMPAQEWILKEGMQVIKFKSFVFTGSKQYFEIDSFSLSNHSASGHDSVFLQADQFGFKSSDLQAFYEKNALEFDTVWCLKPSLVMHLQKENTNSDTTVNITALLKALPFSLSINHLDVLEGRFGVNVVRSDKTITYHTDSANLKVDQIEINPADTPIFSTGTILLDAHNLSFFTPDSLYALTLREFEINGNDIRLVNAALSPTAANKDQSFNAIITEFLIVDLVLEELLQHRIAASSAVLSKPVISIRNPKPTKSSNQSDNDITVFYDALHGLSRLIAVNKLVINDGTLNYSTEQPSPVDAKVNGLHIELQLKEFLKVRALIDVKKAITRLEANQILLNAGKLHIGLDMLIVQGRLQHNNIEALQIKEDGGISLTARDIYWQKLDWNELKSSNSIIADSVDFGYLSVKTLASGRQKASTNKDLPVIDIKKLTGDKIEIDAGIQENSFFSTLGQHIDITQLKTSGKVIQWQEAKADFTNTIFTSEKAIASIQLLQLNTLDHTTIRDLNVAIGNSSDKTQVVIPSIEMELPLRSTDFSEINVPAVTLLDPVFSIEKQNNESTGGKPLTIPLAVTIGKLDIKRANVLYKVRGKDSPANLSFFADLLATKIQAFKDNPQVAMAQDVTISVYDQAASITGATAMARSLTIKANDLNLMESSTGNETAMQVTGSLQGKWTDFSLNLEVPKNKGYLRINNLSGSLNPTSFAFSKLEKVKWPEWAHQLSISKGQIIYTDSINTISAGSFSWSNANTLKISEFKFEPKMQPEEYFLKTEWQSDFIVASAGSLSVTGLDLNQLYLDSVIAAGKVDVTDPVVNVWRDKRIPFKHGINKYMPTSLILSVSGKAGFKIDSAIVKNGEVNYHEFSSVTNQMGIVPLKAMHAVITNLKNVDIGQDDSLNIHGNIEMFGSMIKKISYHESYFDTLSSFNMTFIGTPMQLTSISHVSKPLAAIQINSGECNTLSARISGNSFAAFGELKFYYRDLNVSLLDHHDSLRNRIDLAFVNLIANELVIKSNNRKKSTMFFIRDQEKFVFNYWIKTLMSGVLTSAGVKKDKKYYNTYKELRQVYNLPEMNF